MARLRKPAVEEPSIFMSNEDSHAPSRKSTRKLRYADSRDDENQSILVPKSSRLNLRDGQNGDSIFGSRPMTPNDTLTPRKQRVLRPVESNSRLLRKISNETLASPEKKQRARRVRSGTTDTDLGRRGNLMYSKSLAKSVMKRRVNQSLISVVGDDQSYAPSQADTQFDILQSIEVDVDAGPHVWCDEDETNVQSNTKESGKNNSKYEDSDEDEDPVVCTKQRRPQQSRRIVSDSSDSHDSDSETTSDNYALSTAPTFKVPKLPMPREYTKSTAPLVLPPEGAFRKSDSNISNWAQDVIDLTNSPDNTNTSAAGPPTRTRTSSFASRRASSPVAILTYSPTPKKNRSPCKEPPVSRPATPTRSCVSPTKLVSPSKKKPVASKEEALRPSLDAFWMPEAVNEDLPEQARPLVSPRKQKWREDIVKIMDAIDLEGSNDGEFQSPTTSPKKKQSRSPTKKRNISESAPGADVRKIRAQRKEFEARKHALADSFIAELDATVCSGQVGEMTKGTGGVKLKWSKTLKTTAGRANWRRETIRVRCGPLPTDIRKDSRHHCSIELAEKVIDCEERLYNVLAHEFCHLTTFMISQVRTDPHGPEFKKWGRKVTDVFKHKGVEVTIKHSYQIDYKYIWECVECGYEFKRHSKSIDPERHSCGKCKAILVQTKPKPRGTTAAGGKREMSEYQVYVKANFARVKKQLESESADASMGKVMAALGKEYRANKEKVAVEVKKEVIDLEEALGGMKL